MFFICEVLCTKPHQTWTLMSIYSCNKYSSRSYNGSATVLGTKKTWEGKPDQDPALLQSVSYEVVERIGMINDT